MTDDIEDIRERKMKKLQEMAESEEEQSQQGEQSSEPSVDDILQQALSADARKRLNTAEMARPEMVEKVKQSLARAYQLGQIQSKLSEEDVKQILKKASEQESTDFDVKRR